MVGFVMDSPATVAPSSAPQRASEPASRDQNRVRHSHGFINAASRSNSP